MSRLDASRRDARPSGAPEGRTSWSYRSPALKALGSCLVPLRGAARISSPVHPGAIRSSSSQGNAARPDAGRLRTAPSPALPWSELKRSGRAVSGARGVDRVFYDISSKPASTTEWE